MDLTCPGTELFCSVSGLKKARGSISVPSASFGLTAENKFSAAELITENRRDTKKSGCHAYDSYAEVATTHSAQFNAINSEGQDIGKVEPNSYTENCHNSRSSGIFKKKSFSFSSSFPILQVGQFFPLLQFQ